MNQELEHQSFLVTQSKAEARADYEKIEKIIMRCQDRLDENDTKIEEIEEAASEFEQY